MSGISEGAVAGCWVEDREETKKIEKEDDPLYTELFDIIQELC